MRTRDEMSPIFFVNYLNILIHLEKLDIREDNFQHPKQSILILFPRQFFNKLQHLSLSKFRINFRLSLRVNHIISIRVLVGGVGVIIGDIRLLVDGVGVIIGDIRV